MHSPRRAAVSVLRAWSKGHAYADGLIDRNASRNNLSSADRALLHAIVYGVLRHRRLLDHWIGSLRRGKLDHETRDILRVGLCQLLILKLPDHAAVFETVELGKSSVRGLLNAVLRRAVTSREKLLDVSDLSPAVAHSHPDWLAKRWRKQFGAEDAAALMAFNNVPAPISGQPNPLHPEVSPDESAQTFSELPAELLAAGKVYLQDPATRHSVDLMAPQPDELVLDACAAPGGKAFLIAAAQGSGANLVCTDSNEKRLPRLHENFDRLGISAAAIDVHDWREPAPTEWHQRYDAILLDVPCSNTGVLRRRLDARWRLTPHNIAELAQTQSRILENALPCVRPGGRLIYSTCSIEPDENRGLVDAFLQKHPEITLASDHQALPHRDKTDGSYAARLEIPS